MIRRLLFRQLIPLTILLAATSITAPARADGRFNAPAGVAVDRFGNVYVADTGNSRIWKLSPTGVVLRVWTERAADFGEGTPTGVAVDRAGVIYVTDVDNATVLKYGPRGGFVGRWAHAGDGEFASPQGIAVGGRGSVFVANTDNNNIEKLTTGGYIQNAWSVDDQSGQAASPQWIAVSPDGAIYTTVQNSDSCGWCQDGYSIQKRSSNGTLVATWPRPEDVVGIALGGRGNIFVVAQDSGEVIKVSPDGQELVRFGANPVGGLSQPTGIAVDGRGDIYVADTGNNRIVKLSPTGDVVSVWS